MITKCTKGKCNISIYFTKLEIKFFISFKIEPYWGRSKLNALGMLLLSNNYNQMLILYTFFRHSSNHSGALWPRIHTYHSQLARNTTQTHKLELNAAAQDNPQLCLIQYISIVFTLILHNLESLHIWPGCTQNVTFFKITWCMVILSIHSTLSSHTFQCRSNYWGCSG